MGRGGYNGGDPSVNDPKVDDSYISLSSSTRLSLLRDSQIVQSGVGLKNERGGIQHEFGYIIKTELVDPAQQSKGISRLFDFRKRRRGPRTKSSYTWVAASALLVDAHDIAREYHSKNPEAPKPYWFDQEVEAAGRPKNG